jgi:flavin reductase (DIM6/NTAB) family NADH-FMN oxidoreductase RutF
VTAPGIIDAANLRRVFGLYPTGVAVVAGLVDGAPVGLAANSFTSVSMDPPLVSVCLAHTSTTWPQLRDLPRIGVSFLAGGQETVGRQLATKSIDRFAGLSWRQTADGAVLLDGASGWLEVSVEQQVRAGDHDIVVLAVHDLGGDHTVHPLIFHASQFRKLIP